MNAMKKQIIWNLIGSILFVCLGFLTISSKTNDPLPPKQGVVLSWKGRKYHLEAIMQLQKGQLYQRGGISPAELTLSANCYYKNRNYVEIVRQDAAIQPSLGIAIGFEFDEENGEYPYSPSEAVLQIKDFSWGGVEFSALDTLNYTGVSNSVSDDFSLEILSWENDTIIGVFSGLLLNGAGDQAPIDSGYFKVELKRR
jgi:hypothetical protein